MSTLISDRHNRLLPMSIESIRDGRNPHPPSRTLPNLLPRSRHYLIHRQHPTTHNRKSITHQVRQLRQLGQIRRTRIYTSHTSLNRLKLSPDITLTLCLPKLRISLVLTYRNPQFPSHHLPKLNPRRITSTKILQK